MSVFYWKNCSGLYLCLSFCLNWVFYFHVPKKIVYKSLDEEEEKKCYFFLSHTSAYLLCWWLNEATLLSWNGTNISELELQINMNIRCKTKNQSSYHISVVGVEGLIDERELIRSQPLLTIDQLGKLGKRGFSNKTSVSSVMWMWAVTSNAVSTVCSVTCLNTFM